MGVEKITFLTRTRVHIPNRPTHKESIWALEDDEKRYEIFQSRYLISQSKFKLVT